MQSWQRVKDDLYLYRDSCNVWALTTNTGMIVVNAGTGAWLSVLDALPQDVHAVVLTHFFRDHTAGARRAAEHGMPVWASRWEAEQLGDAEALFQRRETYIIYDNVWDLYSPVASVPVTRWLNDWEQIELGSTRLTILPTPGVSLGAISIAISDLDVSGLAQHQRDEEAHEYQPRGVRGVFAGEVIHSRGRIARIAPLQYNYNDLTGATHLLYSIGVIREADPGWIAPSLGPNLVDSPESSLDALEENLRFALESRGEPTERIRPATEEWLEPVTTHLQQSGHAVASTFFVRSESGKVLSIDFGYRSHDLGLGGEYSFPRHRRPLLHGVEALRREHGVSRIDAVLVTHFHDDHVNGIPLLQRLFGTDCFAASTFAHILADPAAYAFPCTWPEPIAVTVLNPEEVFRWEEYEFTLHPISGHTRFATMICFDADGKRIVATGDQFFFQDFEHPGRGPAAHNHVYRNGAWLSSIRESVEIITRLRPDIILPGHGPAYHTTDEWFAWVARYADTYEEIHTRLMPLDDCHFEVDSRAAWLAPYRTHANGGGEAGATDLEFTVHLRNPYPRRTTLEIRPQVPDGWITEPAQITLEGRAEGATPVRVRVPAGTRVRRQAIAIDLSGPDRQFGEVAEALVTVGFPAF